jgi:hypothetical protein
VVYPLGCEQPVEEDVGVHAVVIRGLPEAPLLFKSEPAIER